MKNAKQVLVLLCTLQVGGVGATTNERLDDFLALSLEQLMDMEVSISTASGQPLSKAPAVVSVITRADMLATGATNLAEVLEGVPGIHVRVDRFGFRPFPQFRGANAKQTLLMINGNSVSDLMWGYGIFWKGLPVSAIDRVEIIRGPGSALFGADASAGAINIITRTAGRIAHSDAGMRIGSFDTRSAWLQHGARLDDVELGITAEFSTSGGYDPYIDADGIGGSGNAPNGWDNVDLRMSLAKGDWRLMYDFVRHSDLQIGLTGGYVLDTQTRGSDSRHDLALLYSNDQFNRDWGLAAELRYQQLEYSSGDGFLELPPGWTEPAGTGNTAGLYPDGFINRMRSGERKVSGEVSGLYKGIDGHAIRIGGGYTWQDLYRVEQYVNFGIGPNGSPLPAGGPLVDISDTPQAFAPEKARRIVHLFVQDVWSIRDDLELTAGARYDSYSDFGSTINPRVALVWNTTDRLTSKLMYGEAFRAPNYQELYARTANALPNTSLGPERSQTVDLQFAFRVSPSLQLGANLFHFRQEDLIRSVVIDPVTGTRQFQNVGTHTIKGVELEAWWQASERVRVSGNYTVRDPGDSTYQSYDQPRRQAYARVDWTFLPGWSMNLQTNWIGERERVAGDPRPALEGYAITDATLRFSAMKKWELAASVRNLFDSDAREATSSRLSGDLPLPGRSAYVEARYRFD